MGDLLPEVGPGDSSVRGWRVGGQGGQEVRLRPGSILSDGRPSQGIWPGGKRPGLLLYSVVGLATVEVGSQGGEVGSGYQDPAVMRVSREAVRVCARACVCKRKSPCRNNHD